MRNNYILISVISAIVLAAIVYAVTLVGFPLDARGQAFDNTRISNLRDLKYQIDAFTQKTYRLPSTLQELKTDSPYVVIKDPETKKDYEYYPNSQSTYSYKLCANFSTSSDTTSGKTQVMYSYDTSYELFQHPKGNHCFDVTVQLNVYNNPPALPKAYVTSTPNEEPTPLPQTITDANIADISTNVSYNENLSIFPAGFFSNNPNEYGLINYHDEPVTITITFKKPVQLASISNVFSFCTDKNCYSWDIQGITDKNKTVDLGNKIIVSNQTDKSDLVLKTNDAYKQIIMKVTRIGGPDHYVHWKKITLHYK